MCAALTPAGLDPAQKCFSARLPLECLYHCVLRCATVLVGDYTVSGASPLGGSYTLGSAVTWAWGDGMSQLFSTELVPVSDRVDAWQWNAQQICGNCRIRLPRASFHGSIEVRQIGALKLTRFSSSPLSFWKWPEDSVAADKRSCIVITQIHGSRRYIQKGTDVLLNAGDSTVIDSGQPWSSMCETDCVRLYLRVPRWMMEDRLRTRDIPTGRRISGASTHGIALSRVSQWLYDGVDNLGGESASTLDSYFGTLAACLGQGQRTVQHGSDLLAKILHYVNSHLANPGLSPLDVASTMGISLRHLHRVFSTTGSTLGEYIKLGRLERCREDLVNPRLANRSITDIAFFWGFCDAAHFSHSFRRHYGVPARALREANRPHIRLRSVLPGRVTQVRQTRPN